MNGDHNELGAYVGASLLKSSASALSLSHSNRASPFPATTHATKNAMAAPAFLSSSQSFRSSNGTTQSSFPVSVAAMNAFERDATTNMPVGTPFAAAGAGGATSALIRRLPFKTSEESLRLMMVFSKDLVSVEILPVEQSEDVGFLSAVLKFKTHAGALEAKNMLDGKSNISNDADMVVEILGASPPSKRYALDTTIPNNGASTAGSSTASSATSSRQPSRFNGGAFSSLEKVSPPLNGAPVFGGASDLTSPDSSAHYQSIFSPQSPIGNHLTDRSVRVTGKSLINDVVDDDETGELLKDPVAYAENGAAMASQQRRATAPHIPINRLASLSLAAAPPTGPASMQYGHSGIGPLSGHPHSMPPTVLATPSMGYSGHHHYRGHNFPPVNPADQNPPCNTLYVGNLPIDTSEEELKAMFSKQRGYKRLCFRTKQNGPMCFVEFEDVSFATKALHELYGSPLHNSVKGGIRLSFSKNPLGVRSGQATGQHASGMASMNSMMAGSGGSFTTANGPPPGLSAPPGIRGSSYNNHGNHGFGNPVASGWNQYNGGSSILAGAAANYPPHMMGR